MLKFTKKAFKPPFTTSQYRLEDEEFESNPAEKGLRMLMDENLSMAQQCMLTAHKDKSILGCIESIMAAA